MPRLKSLFLNNAEFLLAGNKSKLLTELLKFLYFDYEIHFPPFPHETDKGVEIIRLSHLETAEFPEGYPQCVIDVLKIVSDERSTNVTPLPTIIQTLNISNVELENGAEKRKREAEERRRRELEEEERKRLAWLAIPKRLRGMVFARAMRAAGKLVVIAAYRFPRRPTTCNVRGHVLDECGNLTLNMALASAGAKFKVTRNPRLWEKEMERFVFQSLVKSMRIKGFREGGQLSLQLNMKGSIGPSVDLREWPHMREWTKNIMRRRDGRLLHLPYGQNPLSVPLQDRSSSMLGGRSERRIACYQLRAKPRREVGKGFRLCSRTIKKSGVTAIYTLFYTITRKRKKRKMNFHYDPDHPEVSSVVEDQVEAGSSTVTGSTAGRAPPSAPPPPPSSRSVESKVKVKEPDAVPEMNTLALGLTLTLEFYVPHRTALLGCEVRESSLYR
eukprot:gene1426-1626_t